MNRWEWACGHGLREQVRTAQPATEWRQIVAHGVSRGMTADEPQAPAGAKESMEQVGRDSAAPAGAGSVSHDAPTAHAVGYSLSLLRS